MSNFKKVSFRLIMAAILMSASGFITSGILVSNANADESKPGAAKIEKNDADESEGSGDSIEEPSPESDESVDESEGSEGVTTEESSVED